MSIVMHYLAAVCAAVAIALPAHAGAETTGARETMNVRGSRLLGMDVQSKGKEVGELKDVVVDAGTGEARYAILSYGGVLGIADRLYAVPLSVVRLSPRSNETLAVSLDEEELRKLPAFVPDRWPEWADTAYWDNVERRGNTRDTTQARGFRHGMRLSQLIGRDVQNRSGDEVGEVKDAVIDLAHQRVSFVVLSVEALPRATGPDVLQEDRLVPVPLQFFYPPGSSEAAKDALVLRVRESRLRTLPGFEDDAWPDFNDTRFVAAIRRETGRLFRDDFSATR